MAVLGLSVYWTMLHARNMEYQYEDLGSLLHQYLVHTFPPICLGIVYMTTERLVIKQSHWLIVAPFVPIMGYMNYYGAMKRGEALYWFLDWVNDFWTALATLHLIFATFVLIWIAMAKMTRWGNGPAK